MKKFIVLLVCAVVLLVGDTVLDKGGTQSSFDPKKDYEQVEAFYNNKEYDKAAELFKKACDGGEMRGCRYLGIMYANGKGVEKDLGKAAELYKKACDGGIMRVCNVLGFMYEYGNVVEKDLGKAA